MPGANSRPVDRSVSVLAFCFPRQLQDHVIGCIGERHGNLGRLPASLLSVADQFEEHGFEFGPAGLHSLV